MNKKNIAIIGSGIAGLSAAYLLSNYHNITIFEKEDYYGGHTRTVKLDYKKKNIYVDTGFIVFNEITYPDLSKFFDKLNVNIEKSNMSLSITSNNLNFEYGSENFFYQIKTFSNIKFLRIMMDLIPFYIFSKNILKNNVFANQTIDDFFINSKYSKEFLNYHIYPIISSIWSTNINDVKKFPMKSFMEFFIQNKLFNLFLRPKWKTLSNKGKSYIDKVINNTNIVKKNNCKIHNIKRNNKSINIFTKTNEYIFDEVILATHADQALKIIDNPTTNENRILRNFKYNSCQIYLHEDINQMPKNRKIWSSWNYLGEIDNKFSLTYWMNKLQNLKIDKNLFVTVNPIKKIEYNKIINKHNFEHPIFTIDNENSKKELNLIQGVDKIWFTGSYFGYGHHEDAIQSSISIAKKMGINIPWKRDHNLDNRISILDNYYE